MNNNRGSIGLMILTTALFLALVAHSLVIYISRTAEREREYLHDEQLRRLCNSTAMYLAGQTLTSGEASLLTTTLYPGTETVQLTRKVKYSEEETFRYLEVVAQSTQGSQKLRQMRFELPAHQKEQARAAMIICGKEITATELLNALGIEYTSNEEVLMPTLNFLKNSADKYSIADMTMSDIKQDGLNKRCYYLSSETGVLTFPANMKVYGTALIATEGNIVIGKNCHFFDKVILLANGTIKIEDGAVLDQALLMSYGKLSVGSESTLKGVAFCGALEISADAVLEHDENVVAPFSSAFYIT